MVAVGTDGQCVGVTDGAYTFAPDLGLKDVMDRFKNANDPVTKGAKVRPYWSIAVVVPLPKKASGLSEALRHELEGAYVAQYRANQTSELGDRPRIRMLIANVGEKAEHWQQVAEMLNARVLDQDESLVAIVGLGQSLDTTKQFIEHIEAGRRTAPDQPLPPVSRLPMIATRLTADNLSTNPDQERIVQGLFRISPTNSDQITAVAKYLTGTTTLIVQDTNHSDDYTLSLGAAVKRAFSSTSPATLLESERYDSSLPGIADAFKDMMDGICIKGPQSIYYSGRGVDLPAFLSAVSGRACLDKEMDIFTGDDGVDLTATLRQQIAAGNNQELSKDLNPANGITLRYTNLAHPGAWAKSPDLFHPQAIGRLNDPCSDCFSRLFPNDNLDDGAAIASYDAVLVAVNAIRDGYSDKLPLGQGPGVARQQIYRFNSAAPVPGASGRIFFDEWGKPVGKPIPILQLNNDGSLKLVDLIHK